MGSYLHGAVPSLVQGIYWDHHTGYVMTCAIIVVHMWTNITHTILHLTIILIIVFTQCTNKLIIRLKDSKSFRSTFSTWWRTWSWTWRTWGGRSCPGSPGSSYRTPPSASQSPSGSPRRASWRHQCPVWMENRAWKRSIRRFVIIEKAPTSAFTFKYLRHLLSSMWQR